MLAAGSAFSTTGALANSYTGMLNTGELHIQLPALQTSLGAGQVYVQDAWSAPAGTQFAAFAYTAGAFTAQEQDVTGGLSVGFKGSGGSAPTDVNFPWTDDCSITEQDAPRVWVNGGGDPGVDYGAQGNCSTSGSTGGWNYTNSEIDSNNPQVDPASEYRTLTLSVWCARDSSCSEDDSAGGAVTNLSGYIDDPNSHPSGEASWTTSVNAGSWYQTDTSGPALSVSASDPAGVCAIGVKWSGPTAYYTQATDDNPGTENPGSPVGSEFDSVAPCGGNSASRTVTMPSGIASGTYSLAIVASNPGNWAGGSGLNTAPTIASYSSAIDVDDTTPGLAWVNNSSAWTANTTEDLDVTAGPSGVTSVTCTDGGGSVAPTLISGSTSGSGTTVWSVPMTDTAGANSVSCSAPNGDVNGALTGNSPAATFNVDTTVPVVSFADLGYTSGDWTNQSQTITVNVAGGRSGIKGISCLVDGDSVSMGGADANQVSVAGDGPHVVDCTAVSGTGVTGSNTFSVNIDTHQPSLTFLVNGAAPSSDWLSGTPVVTVIGGETGGILSGIKQISCSVDGGTPFTLFGISAASDYTSSFELQQNGADEVSCTGVTVAGTTQATPSTVTANVDNPNYSPDPSALIDGGHDPFSDGPSQSQWYRTPQSVTITADDTGGPAPIASISCKGALTGTWPLSSLNTDAQGGERITVTVSAPGGDLSCTAQDAAGNVYVLGSYLFQIDDTPPTGYFLPQNSWPEPDEIAIHATDAGGSGVAVVRVYGQSATVDAGQPQLVGDAQYDAASHSYLVTVPDGIAPWVAENWTFYANVIDVAGNQGQITSTQDGSTEDLSLPLRDYTSVSAAAQRVTATAEPAIPTALAAAALGGSAQSGSLARASLARSVRTPVAADSAGATIASVKTKARKPSGTKARKPAGHVLTVHYGKAVTVTGVLKDLARGGRPIVGAKVLIYQEIVGAKAYAKLGSAKTKANGRYTYRVKPGASRTLYVVYSGTELLRPAASDLQEKFGGKLTVGASGITAGAKLIVTGAVKGGHIPSGGLSVTIDYRQVGAPGSGTLGTVRTNGKGRYRFTQHFATATRGLVYELWAVVPKQAKWPYLKAMTKRLIRHVR
jgi:hypothetical protein